MYFKKMFLLTAVLLLSALMPKEASAGTVLTDKRINFIEMHADSAIRYGASFDMPWEVAMTISALESGDGDSPAARNGYNLHYFRRRYHAETLLNLKGGPQPPFFSA